MGTYYRAPPGGVSIQGKQGAPFPGQPVLMDGGFYIPDDPAGKIHVYKYFSTAPAAVSVPDAGLDCSSVAYAYDPATARVSLVAMAAGGAVGGAMGGIAGRSMAGHGLAMVRRRVSSGWRFDRRLDRRRHHQR